MTNADDIDAIRIGPDPDKLLAYNRQQLSAMLDGELSPDEAKFMLRRLQHDGELAACWERWQVCGDMLRGRHHALLPSDFADRVARGISGGSTPIAAEQAVARSPRFLRWSGGAALAASVALVAVFAARQLPDPMQSPQSPGGQPVIASSSGSAMPAAVALADAADANPASPSPIDVAPAILATALAAAEAPRRNAERRARAQQPRRATTAVAVAEDAAPDAMALAPDDIVPRPRHALAATEAFPTPPTLQPRPWPRAILPGASDASFAVGYGRLPMLTASADEYDPFRPQLADPSITTSPASTVPTETAGGANRTP